MNNLKKLKGVSHLFLALMLVLMTAAISCDMGQGYEPEDTSITPGQVENPGQGDDNDQTQQDFTKNHYTEYADFNPADYPILNESGKSDSDIAWLKDIIWLMYAEREDIGEWTANYIKTNKIKTILSDGTGGWAWVHPSELDRFYLNEDAYSNILGSFWYEELDDKDKAKPRGEMFGFITHETMHLVQYKSNVFNLMKGMRPDICAATEMLKEYLAWFYTDNRYPGMIITANMANAVERQSKIMELSVDPWGYDDARAKDPSLPDYIIAGPWFNNELNGYMQYAITSVREDAMTAPLRQASKEDMLKIARAMLACRDPKMAGVTDDALWTVFDALCQAAVGNSKYVRFGNGGGSALNQVDQGSFDAFLALMAEWNAAFAAQ